RRRVWRYLDLGAAVVLLAGFLALLLSVAAILVFAQLAALALAIAASGYAFRRRVKRPPAVRPKHPVLFYNPRSGGGRAAQYHLPEEARARGIEAVELVPGADLAQLVREALDRGADALAMAGGDGSQATVAVMAAERGVPYACIPAGTRNH